MRFAQNSRKPIADPDSARTRETLQKIHVQILERHSLGAAKALLPALGRRWNLFPFKCVTWDIEFDALRLEHLRFINA